MTPSITYIKQLCVTFLKSEDDVQKAEIINLIKKEAETL